MWAGKARQAAFEMLVEKSFIGESAFELLKGLLQGAGAVKVDGVDNQLVVASRFIDGDPAAADHMGPVLGNLRQITLLHFEQHRLDLGAGILEGEIEMAGIGFVQIGDFAGDADKGKSPLKQAADGAVELGDGQDLAIIHGFLRNGQWR